MKRFFILVLLFFISTTFAQDKMFPQDWLGEWQGDLHIYSIDKTNEEVVTTIPMEIQIVRIDNTTWKWTIDYKTENQVPRNYELQFVNNQWQIDEKNGIVIPQKLLNGKLMSSFVVGNNQVNCSYELQNNQLVTEITLVNVNEEFAVKTGLRTKEIPEVIVHKTMNYQKAILNKVQ